MDKMNFLTINELETEIKKKVTQLEEINKINKTDFLEVFFIELEQSNIDQRITKKLFEKMSSIDFT